MHNRMQHQPVENTPSRGEVYTSVIGSCACNPASLSLDNSSEVVEQAHHRATKTSHCSFAKCCR